MIKKIKRQLYYQSVSDSEGRKALAFAILIKSRRPASTVPHWSYRTLAAISGKSAGFCKKYVSILRGLGLVRQEFHTGSPYLVFKPLRCQKLPNKRGTKFHTPRYMDIDISKIDCSSFKTIELGLRSLMICAIQSRKETVSQLIFRWRNPKNSKEYRRLNKVCCGRGYDEFSDSGLSYTKIAKNLRCGRSTVSEAIRYGERVGMFQTVRSDIAAWDGHSPNSFQAKDGFCLQRNANKYQLL